MLLYLCRLKSFGFKLPCLGIITLATKFSAGEKKHNSETALGRETVVDAFLHLTRANLAKVIYLISIIEEQLALGSPPTNARGSGSSPAPAVPYVS